MTNYKVSIQILSVTSERNHEQISGTRTHERLQQFTRFTLSVNSQHAPNNASARVGYFQLFPDSLTTFNEDCVNTISEASDYPKTEVIQFSYEFLLFFFFLI